MQVLHIVFAATMVYELLPERFREAIALFNAGDFENASEAFEDLFFESIRDEVDFVRVFLQVSVGIHHVERGQCRAAIERLEEGVRVIGTIENDRGYDLVRLAADVRALLPRIASRLRGGQEQILWPKVYER